MSGAPAVLGQATIGRRVRVDGLFGAAGWREPIRNLLVVAAPAAAGVLAEPGVIRDVLLAFVALSLAGVGSSLLGKRSLATGALLTLAGLTVAALVGLGLLALVGGYVALSLAYSFWLRSVAVVDLGIAASTLVIRAAAGGVAVGVPLSRWFLIVVSFGALFVVAGRRYAEGESAYSRDYLRFVWSLASAVALTAYCLWAFEQGAQGTVLPWYELSIGPFVLGLMRYALLRENGESAAPEDLLLSDRPLQLATLAWAIVFACGVYLGG